MKAVTTHGVFLGVMLVLAYQAWKPEDEAPARANRDGDVAVWEFAPDQVRRIAFSAPRQTTVIERREEGGETYLWGLSHPTSPPDSGAAAAVEEFAIGEQGDEMWDRVARLTALRDLGVLDEDEKELYELNDPDRRLTVADDDTELALVIGGTVYAGSHRYALDPASGVGYVLSADVVRDLENGPSALRLRTPHRFDRDDVAAVTVRGASSERRMTRRPGNTTTEDSWVSPDAPGDPDQTFKNFMDHVQQLMVMSYERNVSVDTMEFRVQIDYAGETDTPLGSLRLYRAPGIQDGIWNYYVQSESSRVPALATRSLAERVDRDLADLF